MRFYLTALGCKLNQAEIESLARKIAMCGHQVAARPQEGDWAIINTCSVTHIADRKSRQLIRRLHRDFPHMRIAVTGCYAELAPDALHKIEGVDLIIPNAAKDSILQQVLASSSVSAGQVSFTEPEVGRLPIGRTRAWVKIQDGCDNRCTYCIVRVARGAQQSRPPGEVIKEIQRRSAQGYQEIVLTGVHIGAYGRDSAPGAPLPPERGWNLAHLVRTILEETGIPRLRLSSTEPWDFGEELLDLWEDARLCRHIHLPLQSGCDQTLQRMERKYTTQRYGKIVDAIRRRIPDVSLTTDVIVGFPGETDAEYRTTLSFVERMAFSRLHVFRYSRREGTLAINMPQQIPSALAQARSGELIALGQRMARDFHQKFVGKKVQVLFEGRLEGGKESIWQGLTDNYLRVYVRCEKHLANTPAEVLCLSADETGLRGELVSQ
ncbi:MAG: tRNA (N(6)-L-threonylcarbamoyladenosine(37)-C(2))-methylthiotransferase MtaB [Chloroflexi bacterium RBG_13_56_8]|nr:MAG: tRNA (N(6)-L-threonylcarbamoyladenosine(37)-C(2))-methylthiotransferase MtaB [Chloroflexi bacterium RBG_13_56_8]